MSAARAAGRGEPVRHPRSRGRLPGAVRALARAVSPARRGIASARTAAVSISRGFPTRSCASSARRSGRRDDGAARRCDPRRWRAPSSWPAPRLTAKARCLLRGYGLPRWGNLRRTTPFSSSYGFERGTPIDRYYLHRFLSAHRDLITGDVLEVQTNSVHRALRPRRDARRHVRHRAAVRADLSLRLRALRRRDSEPRLRLPAAAQHAAALPRARSRPRAVAAHRPARAGRSWRRPAGLLPLTGDVPDYWRLSPDGWRETLAAAWPGADDRVAGHGNCLAAVAAQLGLALEELTRRRARRARSAISGADDHLLPHAAMTTLPFADSVKTGLLATGWYANRLAHDAFPGVLGLCYHGIRESSADAGTIPFANLHVIAETFDAHCRMIAETCHPIDLATFCDARATGAPLPERPVLVTFDDGYRSVFELARPILLRHKIPATVFVCSEPVRRQRLFWFDAVARALGPAAVADLRARPDEGWRTGGGRARHARQRRAAPRADDRGAGAPARRRGLRDRRAHGLARAARGGAARRAASRARVVPLGARIVDGPARSTRWRIRSARRARTTPTRPSRSRRISASRPASRRAATSPARRSRRSSARASSCWPR